MKTLFALGVWCLLFVLCWPLAILALIAWPFVWLLSLPFRLVGITFSALFAFLRALFMLPARLLGGGRWPHEGCAAGRVWSCCQARCWPTPGPPSAWLEREQALRLTKPMQRRPCAKAEERCRVVKQWKAGDTVVQHRVCEDPPKKPAGKV
jgi:hypothetical protein